MSVSVLTLLVDIVAFFNNPWSMSKKSTLSLLVSHASGLSPDSLQQDTSTKYYVAQFTIDKSQYKKAPEFMQVTGYVNTNPIKLSDLKGKVVSVHFWTYTCINCIHTIPHLNDWYAKYSRKGFVIAGIQTPEFEFAWNAYGNWYWPRDYLIDNEGYIRYDHVGEGGYNETEKMIRSLLTEPGTNANVNQTGNEL